jgi:hypothetical protein
MAYASQLLLIVASVLETSLLSKAIESLVGVINYIFMVFKFKYALYLMVSKPVLDPVVFQTAWFYSRTKTINSGIVPFGILITKKNMAKVFKMLCCFCYGLDGAKEQYCDHPVQRRPTTTGQGNITI